MVFSGAYTQGLHSELIVLSNYSYATVIIVTPSKQYWAWFDGHDPATQNAVFLPKDIQMYPSLWKQFSDYKHFYLLMEKLVEWFNVSNMQNSILSVGKHGTDEPAIIEKRAPLTIKGMPII